MFEGNKYSTTCNNSAVILNLLHSFTQTLTLTNNILMLGRHLLNNHENKLMKGNNNRNDCNSVVITYAKINTEIHVRQINGLRFSIYVL